MLAVANCMNRMAKKKLAISHPKLLPAMLSQRPVHFWFL